MPIETEAPRIQIFELLPFPLNSNDDAYLIHLEMIQGSIWTFPKTKERATMCVSESGTYLWNSASIPVHKEFRRLWSKSELQVCCLAPSLTSCLHRYAYGLPTTHGPLFLRSSGTNIFYTVYVDCKLANSCCSWWNYIVVLFQGTSFSTNPSDTSSLAQAVLNTLMPLFDYHGTINSIFYDS